MDLSALRLQTDKPQRLLVLHPVTREPLGDAWIDLWSLDSDVAKKHNHRAAETRAGKRRQATAAEIEGDAVALLVALTADWRLAAPDGGAIDLPFSSASATELYGDSGCQWLREQVELFVADRRNYLPTNWR